MRATPERRRRLGGAGCASPKWVTTDPGSVRRAGRPGGAPTAGRCGGRWWASRGDGGRPSVTPSSRVGPPRMPRQYVTDLYLWGFSMPHEYNPWATRRTIRGADPRVVTSRLVPPTSAQSGRTLQREGDQLVDQLRRSAPGRLPHPRGTSRYGVNPGIVLISLTTTSPSGCHEEVDPGQALARRRPRTCAPPASRTRGGHAVGQVGRARRA